MNSYKGKRAYSISLSGGHDQVNFDFGSDTEVYRSCSLHWQNHHYVFGGAKETHQVSMVNGNRLERKAELDFPFRNGGCTVLNQITIVLCFGTLESKVCRKSNNPLGSFTKLPNTKYGHKHTRIASFDGKNTIF